MKLRPIKDKVIVEKVDVEKLTASNIILPETKKEVKYGKVIAIGPYVENLHKGDIVFFRSGIEVEGSYYILNMGQILGILE